MAASQESNFPNQPPGDSVNSGMSPDRIRQVHSVCRILDVENKAAKAPRARSERGLRLSSPHGFMLAVVALMLLVVGMVGTGMWWGVQPDIHQVRDFRWSTNYAASEASDAVLSSDGQRLLLATHGDGLHTIDSQTRYLRHFSQASTAGGLLADDVYRIDQDPFGRLYFLCHHQERLGLCRSREDLREWTTLMGIDRFAALDVENPLSEITAVLMNGDELWIGTRSNGIGRYVPESHTWASGITKSDAGLLDNQVRDFALGADSIWIATPAGINRVDRQLKSWERFSVAEGLAGSDIVRLRWLGGVLWYATARGGLGRQSGSGWETLIPESGWGQHSANEVAAVAVDGDGQFWFATQRGELGTYAPRRRQWFDAGEVANAGRVTALGLSSGLNPVAWLATDQQLLKFDRNAAAPRGAWTTSLNAGIEQLDAQLNSVVVRLAPTTETPLAELRVSTDGQTWRGATGGRGIQTGPRGVLSVATDQTGEQLWLGSERGLSRYDTKSNSWTDDVVLPKTATGGLLDVRVFDGHPVVLAENRDILQWKAQDAKWEPWLGGGKFEGTATDITAVTRDAAGKLWAGTQSKGLFEYAPQEHRWEAPIAFEKPISDLQTSAGKLWLLSENVLHVVSPNRTVEAVPSAALPVVAMAAAPHVNGVVLRGQAGEVVVVDDDLQAQLLVGKAAAGLDLSKVPSVGLLNDFVVCGGAKPHVYRTSMRDWQPLNVGGVHEIVAALGELWLRTSEGLVRFTSDGKTETVDAGGPVAQLVGTDDRIVALLNNGSIKVRQKETTDWALIKEAPQGPAAEIANGEWSVACAGDSLYVAGGKAGEVWHFAWDAQRWSKVRGEKEPLSKVKRLGTMTNGVWALDADGVLHRGSPGQTQMTATNRDLQSVHDGGGEAVATSKSGVAAIYSGGGWQTVVGTAPKESIGEPKMAIAAAGGIVIAGSVGSAWLTDGWSEWRAITAPGAFRVAEFRMSRDGRNVWAVSSNKDLFHLDRGAWAWKAALPAGTAIESLAVVEGTTSDELWVCTNEGAVYRVQGADATLWSRPTASPGRPNEIVGMSTVPGGFLAAFSAGELGYFDVLRRSWLEQTSPAAAARIENWITIGEAPNGCCLMRTVDGKLHRSPLLATPKWEEVAAEVTSCSRQGAAVFAIARNGREIIRVGASGAAETLMVNNGSIPTNWGALVAACELSVDARRSWLLLGFERQLAAYDPDTHRWTPLDRTVRSLVPTASGVLVQAADQSVSLAKVEAGVLNMTAESTGTVSLSGVTSDRRWIELKTDGRVLVHDRAATTSLVGRAWPGDSAKVTVRDLATLGSVMLVLGSDGDLWAYDRQTRDWERVTGVSNARRMVGGKSIAWLETPGTDGSQLVAVTVENEKITTQKRLEGVQRWQVGPTGVLAVVQQAGKIQEVLLRENNTQASLPISVPAGPNETTIGGSRVINNEIWVRANSNGSLWHYRPDARLWSEIELNPASACEVVRFGTDVVRVQEADGELWRGERLKTAPSGWQFRPEAKNVKSFDADDRTLVWTTGQQLVVKDSRGAVDGATRAERDFSTRAWSLPQDEVDRLAAQDDQLVAISKSKNAASYSLSKRIWSAMAPVPDSVASLFFVDSEWCVLDLKGNLSVYRDGKWKPATRTEKAWQVEQAQHAIDQLGRWTVKGAVGRQAPQSVTGAASLGLVRVQASDDWLLLEASDGSLWNYGFETRELIQKLAKSSASPRVGLVVAGAATFFVADDMRKVFTIAADSGQPVEVKIPESLQKNAWSVFLHQSGVVIDANGMGGMLLKEVGAPDEVTAAQVTEFKAEKKSLAVGRQQEAGRWRLVPVPSMNSAPLRLECRFGDDWKAVAVDLTRSRFGWDSMLGGLAVGDRVVLATASGVVIHGSSGTGLPEDYFPIDWLTGTTAGGRVWSLSDNRLLVQANDSRRWLLTLSPDGPARLQAWQVPASAWQVQRESETGPFRLSATFAAGISTPLSLDRAGRLSCDVISSVALMNNSVMAGTAAGLFEYSEDLQTVRRILTQGPSDVMRSADRKTLLLKQSGAGGAFQWDGTKWVESTGWDAQKAELSLANRAAGKPLDWDLDLGTTNSAKRQVRYEGRGLKTDVGITPDVGLMSEATDGQALFVLTLEGLVVRSLTGEWVAVEAVPEAKGLKWVQDDNGAVALAVQAANGNGWLHKDNALRRTQDVAAMKAVSRVTWGGKVWKVDVAQGSQRVVLKTLDGAATEVLDLKERGLLSDRILAAGWDGAAAWLVSPGQIERFVGGDSRRAEVVANPLANRTVQVQPGENRLLATDGSQTVAFNLDGTVKTATLTASEKLRQSALWRSASWRVGRPTEATSQLAAIEFQVSQDVWLKGALTPGSGMSWDRWLGVGGTREQLVMTTQAGDFALPRADKTVQLSLSAWQAVAAAEGTKATENPSAESLEFWSDAAGTLWQRIGAQWQRYQAASGRWERVTALPTPQKEERALLAQSATARWIQAATGMQLVETAGKDTVVSPLKADGTMDSAFVLAMAPDAKTLWSQTRQDLRQIDRETGAVLKRIAPEAAAVTQAEFRSQNGDWFLRSKRGQASEVSRLVGAAWERATDVAQTPFAIPAIEAESGILRLQRSAGGLTAEIRESAKSATWHPVKFSDATGRFEFQMAQDAVGGSGMVMVQTPAGMTVWQQANAKWNLISLRPDLKSVSAPAVTHRLLGKSDEKGDRVEEFDLKEGWKVTALTEEELSLAAQSARWSVTRAASGAGRILARTGDSKSSLVPLPLDRRGDFEFRYPRVIGVTKDGSAWSASDTAVARFSTAPRVEVAPAAIWSDDSRPAGSVGELFVLNDTVHVALGTALRKYDAAQQGWQTVKDLPAVIEQRKTVAANALWQWKRDDKGGVLGNLKLGNQSLMPLRWDPAAGRFDADRVVSVAVEADSVWLSHAGGLSKVARKGGRTEANVAGKPPRLVCDRDLKLWLAQAVDAPDQFAKLAFDPQSKALELCTEDVVVASRTDRYVDREFEFGSDGFKWQGLRSGFIAGRFTHDHFQSIGRSGEQLVAVTPSGVIMWRVTEGALEFVKALPLPAQKTGSTDETAVSSEEFLVDPLSADTLRLIGRKSKRVFEWKEPNGPWSEVSNVPAERTLVDTARWTWKQIAGGEVQLVVKFGDEPRVAPLLNEDGRFAFDDVGAVLCDGDLVWIGTHDGLVLRQQADGEPQKWYRSGEVDGMSHSLGEITRLGRFRDRSIPVASWAENSKLEGSELYALNADGVAWLFDRQKDPPVWRQVGVNPWDAKTGVRVLQEALIEGVQTADGRLELKYARAAATVPVLSAGRLTIDSVRDMTLVGENELFLATRAGVVQAGREAAAFQELWTDSKLPEGLSSAQHVYVDAETGRPRANRSGTSWHEFDATTRSWSEIDGMPQDGESLGEPVVKTDFWTWSRHGAEFGVALHRAGPVAGDWPLFFDGRFSFDVLRDFRLTDKSLVAITPGGVAWFDPESMELRQLDRVANDAETAELVPLLDVQRFAGDGSLTCFAENHVLRRTTDGWLRSAGKERVSEHRFSSGEQQWQVQPLSDGGHGFEVLLHNRQGLLIDQQQVLRGVPESALKRVVPAKNRLWLCLDRGVYFVETQQ